MIPGTANPLLLASATGAAPSYQIERSLRFNSSDSAYLSRTPSVSSTNRTASTYAFWMKLAGKDSAGTQASNMVLSCYDGSSTYALYWSFLRDSNGRRLEMSLGGTSNFGVTFSPSFRDPSAWYHIAIIIDTANTTNTDRVRLYVNGDRITATSSASWPTQNYQPTTFVAGRNTNIGVDFTTSYANYFNGYLADIHFIDGQALDPTSFGEFDANGVWQPKAYTGTYGTNGFHLPFSDNSTAAALGTDTSGAGNDWTVNNISVNQSTVIYSNYVTAENATIDTGYGPITNGFDGNSGTLFRTTNATNSTIVFAPVPSIPITSSLQFRGFIGSNQGWSVKIGSTTLASGTNDPSGNVNWTVPGAAGYTISSSTPLRLISNGSGEGVYWNSLTVDGVELINNAGAQNDSLVDTPTSYGTDTGAGGEVRGNYATLNPLATVSDTLSNGNLDWVSGIAANRIAKNTIGMSSGKWYAEFTPTGLTTFGTMVGICTTGATGNSGAFSTGYGYVKSGNKYIDSTASSYGATWTTNDVIGIALDLDSNQVTFYKNGSSQGAISITSGLIWNFACIGSSASDAGVWNFGQRPFAYPVSGYKALCTTNLPEPQTITTSGSYTGNGAADGPFVYLNGVPTAMTVNGTAVTFGTHADKLSNGFKLRTTSTTYNQNAATYNYSVTSTGPTFKTARAQAN